MSKSSLLLLATTLTVFGAAVMAGHPPWGAVTGVAILLTAGGLAAGALTARSVSEDDIAEQRAGQKVSSGLVALSSAAILAVYAAGYHRTGLAADRFDEQTARRKAAAPIAAVVAMPTAAAHTIVAPPAVQPSAAPRPKARDARRPPAAVPNARPSEPSAATPPSVASAAPAAPDAVKPQVEYKDGTYLGWGSCRHGDIQASVVIQDGRIASTAIAQCLTRYSCSWIAHLPGQVVTRQSPNVDYVSGATQSTDAFSEAISSALAKARE